LRSGRKMITETVSLPMSLKDLSHELRTPVTGIRGCAVLMQDEPLSINQQAFIKEIVEQADKLTNLANLLLQAKVVQEKKLILTIMKLT